MDGTAGSPRQQQGRQLEEAAWRFLATQGHRWIAQNVTCRLGEIDLISQEGNQLIFTEVRWRSRSDYGGAAASVTARKQQRIRHAARFFLMHHPQWQRWPMRFDVIAYDGPWPHPACTWIKGAF